MKRVLVLLLLLLPTAALAENESPFFKVTDYTVGLWFFNGPSIGSTAGDDEAAADNDFSVCASVTAPSYAETGYGDAAHSYADDDSILFSNGDGLCADTASSAYANTTDGITFEYIWKQPSLRSDFEYIVEARNAAGDAGWAMRWLDSAIANVNLEGIWFVTYNNWSGTGPYFNYRFFRNLDIDFVEQAGDWQYYCGYYEPDDIDTIDMVKFYYGKLLDSTGSGSDADLTESTYFQSSDLNSIEDGMKGDDVYLDLNYTRQAPVATAVGAGQPSVLHILNTAKTGAWCEARFDCIKAGECLDRSRFIIQ